MFIGEETRLTGMPCVQRKKVEGLFAAEDVLDYAVFFFRVCFLFFLS